MTMKVTENGSIFRIMNGIQFYGANVHFYIVGSTGMCRKMF